MAIQGISISLFDAEPSELMHVLFQGIMYFYAETGEDKITEAAVQRLQIDNQLIGGVEVIMQPTPLPPEAASIGHPYFQITAVRHNHIGAAHYKNLSILLQVRKCTIAVCRWLIFI